MTIYLGSVQLRQNQYNDGRRSISLIKEREVSFTLNEKYAIHYITVYYATTRQNQYNDGLSGKCANVLRWALYFF
jgi:hypothetical protein